MARITDFRLDEVTWASGTEARKSDWKVLLGELVAHGDFVDTLAGRYLLATASEGAPDDRGARRRRDGRARISGGVGSR